MNYWILFGRSWSIFWRNRALWLFGLLAALSSGPTFYNPGIGDVRRANPIPYETRGLLNQILLNSGLLNAIPVVVGIGLVWAIFAFLVATFAQGALISMVSAIDSGQRSAVSAGFRTGGRRFLPLLAVRIVLALPILLIGLLGAGTVVTTASNLLNSSGQPLFNFGQFSVLAGLSVLSFLVILLVMAIGVGAERAVVLDEMSIGQSLAQGWKMLWSKLRDYLIIAVILSAVGIVAVLVFICALMPIYLGSIIANLGQVLSSPHPPQVFLTTVLGPTLIFMILIDLLLGTWASVFVSSVWTLAYRRWRGIEPQLATPGLPPAAPVDTLSTLEPPKPSDTGSIPASNDPTPEN